MGGFRDQDAAVLVVRDARMTPPGEAESAEQRVEENEDYAEVCGWCAYYERDTRHQGECRRYAPRPGDESRGIGGPMWPQVQESDWCGEFKKMDAV